MPEPENVTLRFDQDVYGTAEDPFMQDEEKIPISELIPRILLERQSFLNVTEEQLEEEIANKGSNDEDADDHEAADAEDTETATQLFQNRSLSF